MVEVDAQGVSDINGDDLIIVYFYFDLIILKDNCLAKLIIMWYFVLFITFKCLTRIAQRLGGKKLNYNVIRF
jgi:hypothetical protein